MRWASFATSVAALCGMTTAADSTIYRDLETGFTFTSYNAKYNNAGSYVSYRVAIPSPVSYGQNFDIVVQIVAPNDVGWAGLAWGGRMTNCPLAVAWANGFSGSMVSSRYAPDHSKVPPTYASAWYEIFKTGTKNNGSHWQVTAKCNGCASFNSQGSTRYLVPNGSNRLAFAISMSKPVNPSSNSSSFNIHDVFNSWDHDFNAAQNSGFTSLVTKNKAGTKR